MTQRGAAVASGSYPATPFQHHHQQQNGSYPVAAAYSNMSQPTAHFSQSSPSSNHGPSNGSGNNSSQPMTLATMAAVASMEADLMGLQQNWSSVTSQQQQQHLEPSQYAPLHLQ
jgi:hypothetical protein